MGTASALVHATAGTVPTLVCHQ
ncbi:MAG TPA: hypothetical protein K8U78_03700 [Aeriscardovia aeriphila]|uniref:Uncharacterized protein n=1 Tax=Aeriscardovia aeriphila TaxID=218139 RepID=A0A921FUF7_9BIFI|nr:hypothetical protein [Aeriscardovia aeriphila]